MQRNACHKARDRKENELRKEQMKNVKKRKSVDKCFRFSLAILTLQYTFSVHSSLCLPTGFFPDDGPS